MSEIRITMGERGLAQGSDEDLIRSVQSGDTDSLGLLAARWEQPLFRFVYRMLPRREDAMDVCQETFLRILNKADRFKAGSRFSTWMYQIALTLCRDQLRRRKRWRLVLADGDPMPERPRDVETDWDDPSRGVARREKREALLRALDELPREQREVLVLKEFEQLKFKEIAEIVGCPESTVKSRMCYGLKSIRSVLVREGIEEP